ncbi:CBS domain-containing protein [Propionivibrio sp.]|uniref:CBS domain-containing protein n=1 Tax=Propionivibrio sp. TaxID=2212460 RepID=UPI00260EDCC6|nr:CBS domain-containing protein [Propionivibrio sp.]
MHKPLPMSKMKPGVVWLPADAHAPKPTLVNSPAIEVMTDLRQVLAATVSAGESVARATQQMIARRVRLLLVVSDDGLIEGLLSARDTMGEKPVKLLQERRGAKFSDLVVGDLMVPRQYIDVLDIDTVLHAEVGSILATLKANGRQHALVIDYDKLRGGEVVRGIFSATQIARQLGVAIPIFEVAQTFAEITSALGSS